jgi:hypothetical protein
MSLNRLRDRGRRNHAEEPAARASKRAELRWESSVMATAGVADHRVYVLTKAPKLDPSFRAGDAPSDLSGTVTEGA